MAGCPAASDTTDASPATGGAARLREVEAGTKIDPKTHVLVMGIKAVSIELPIGTASGSEEIWSYLDEEPIGAACVAALGRNGLRIGLGAGGTWPDLAKVLKRMTGRRFRQSRKLTRPGMPVSFELKKRARATTIFTSHADRTLSGADYPAGHGLLRVLCTLDEDEPTTILVTGMLQIESVHRKASIATLKPTIGLVAEPIVYNFPQLTFQLSVPAKSYVVIGPGAQARRPSSIGQHFLVRERDGAKFETVLVLVPQLLAAPMPKRPQPIPRRQSSPRARR